MNRRRWLSLALGLALGLPAMVIAGSAQPVPITVLFAPGMQAALDTTYGRSQAAVLRKTISERVGAALRVGGCTAVAGIEITLLDARPTHPTDRQIENNPALDRLLTRFLGGADFRVRLLDPAGRKVQSLHYEWYAPDFRDGSRAAEPWGDVRLASEGLGSQLALECRTLARPPHPTAS